ncbi:MAG: helicase C-terminal domain-containing protein, partial [Thermocladium sp.]
VESCPYANPVVSSNRASAVLKAAPNLDEAGRYNSLMGEKVVTVRVGGESCPYYSQFMNYLKSNVIVMNTQMFQYAVLTGSLRIDEGRTLLVLDEADEVIETLIPSTVLSVEWVMENFGVIINAINDAIKRREAKELMSEVIRMIRKAKSTTDVVEIASSINKLFNLVKENDLEVDSLEVLNMINILNKLGSTIDWVRINTDAIGLIVRRIGDYLFNTFFKSFHPHLLFISGTLPNKSMLDYLTSIDWEFIDGRKKMLGKIHLMSKGYTQISALKMRNSNSNDHYKEAIGSGIITTLTAMLDERNRKILVLPHLKVMCKDIIYRRYTGVPYDYDGQLLREFLKNDSPRIVCSTRAVRGVDGSDVDAVVILKAPYPSMDDAFIKAMRKVLGEKDWTAFYTWLAEREVYQMIGRALRREDSEVRLYVSDINVYYIINSLESQGFIELIDESDELGSALFEPSIENELGQFLIPLAIITGTNGGIKMPVAVANRLEEMRAGTIQKIIQEPLQLKNEAKKETQPNKKDEKVSTIEKQEDQDSARDTVITSSITSSTPNKGDTEGETTEAQAKGDVGSVDS